LQLKIQPIVMKKLKIPAHFSYFLSVYGYSLLFYFCFRLILVFATWEYANGVLDKWYWIPKALAKGIVFDSLASMIILFLPFLLFSFFQTFSIKNRFLLRGVHAVMMLAYCVSFLMCVGDVGFFSVFYSRLNAVIFDWADPSDITINIIGSLWYLFVAFGAICALFIWLCGRSLKKFVLTDQNKNPYFSNYSAAISFCLVGLLAYTFTKRITSNIPVEAQAANFSPYAYPNQITLNASYTFIKSLYSVKSDPDVFRFKMMPESTAISIIRKQLGLEGKPWLNGSPLARKVDFETPPQPHNVVLILMESMSAHYLAHYKNMPLEDGKQLVLTPFLDSLAKESVFFDNFFSSGVHTSNGIYSSLTGYPIIPGQHPMLRNPMEEYAHNLPKILRGQGYQTNFFFSHDKLFDNMSQFLLANGIEKHYSQEDYPKEDIVNTWGLPDHKLLRFAIPKITESTVKGKPFFTTLLTISHHAPFYFPTDIKVNYTSQKPENQIVEYSDWAIRDFMEKAKKEPWFDNTIFLLVADHGTMAGVNDYDLPLSMTHVPMLIYAPKIIKPELKKTMGGQIDIPEMILGLLHVPHVNNSFGIDLLRGQRETIFFQNDSKIGSADSTLFSVSRISAKQHSIYKYQERSIIDIAKNVGERATFLERISIAAPQTAQWMIKNGKTK
jgi:phosphoglycerol transferase MdoB-like AlkP superfamily enzyme